MVSDDFAVITNRLPDELFEVNPRHFDKRTLRLERGLYVIRERISHSISDSNARSNEPSLEVFGD